MKWKGRSKPPLLVQNEPLGHIGANGAGPGQRAAGESRVRPTSSVRAFWVPWTVCMHGRWVARAPGLVQVCSFAHGVVPKFASAPGRFPRTSFGCSKEEHKKKGAVRHTRPIQRAWHDLRSSARSQLRRAQVIAQERKARTAPLLPTKGWRI